MELYLCLMSNVFFFTYVFIGFLNFFFVALFLILLPLSLSLYHPCFPQGPNSMFQVFLTGNNSDHFTISPTSVQGRADIRVRVAVPLDYENIRSYTFSVSAVLLFLQCVNQNPVQAEHVKWSNLCTF